jgi:predicted DNA-binding protein YlxM (UPF0122 family)
MEKLDILKAYYVDEIPVKEIAPKFEITERSVYYYIDNKDLLSKFIENLDGFVTKYLVKNSKDNAAYMKMLLENIMHKSAVQKVEMSGDVGLNVKAEVCAATYEAALKELKEKGLSVDNINADKTAK